MTSNNICLKLSVFYKIPEETLQNIFYFLDLNEVFILRMVLKTYHKKYNQYGELLSTQTIKQLLIHLYSQELRMIYEKDGQPLLQGSCHWFKHHNPHKRTIPPTVSSNPIDVANSFLFGSKFYESTEINQLNLAKNRIAGFCFSPDSNLLFIIGLSNNCLAYQHHNDNWSYLETLTGHNEHITAIAHAPNYEQNKTYIVTGSMKGNLLIFYYSLNNNVQLNNMKTEKIIKPVNSLAINSIIHSPTTGLFIAANQRGCEIYRQNAKKEWCLSSQILADEQNFTAIDLNPDNHHIVIGTKHINIWKLENTITPKSQTWKRVDQNLLFHYTSKVNAIAHHPNGKIFITGSNNGVLIIWYIVNDIFIPTKTINDHKYLYPIVDICVPQLGNYFIFSISGSLQSLQFNIETNQWVKRLCHRYSSKELVAKITVSPDGRFLAKSDSSGGFQVLYNKNKLLSTFRTNYYNKRINYAIVLLALTLISHILCQLLSCQWLTQENNKTPDLPFTQLPVFKGCRLNMVSVVLYFYFAYLSSTLINSTYSFKCFNKEKKTVNKYWHRFVHALIACFNNPKHKISDPIALQVWQAFQKYLYNENIHSCDESKFCLFLKLHEGRTMPDTDPAVVIADRFQFLMDQGFTPDTFNLGLSKGSSLLRRMNRILMLKLIYFCILCLGCSSRDEGFEHRWATAAIPQQCFTEGVSELTSIVLSFMHGLSLLPSLFSKRNTLYANEVFDRGNQDRALITPFLLGWGLVCAVAYSIFLHSSQCAIELTLDDKNLNMCPVGDDLAKQCYANHFNAVLVVFAVFFSVTNSCLRVIRNPVKDEGEEATMQFPTH